MQTELRSLTHRAIIATAALTPCALGTGHDSHGNPVPHADRVIADALHRLVKAGRDAQVIIDATQGEEMSR